MLGEIFYWIFNMSIGATICAIPIFLLRLIRNIPRRVLVWLWIIPFFRLAVPVGMQSPYSLMSMLSKFTTKTVTVYELVDVGSFSMMNHVMGANTYFPITYKTNLLEGLFDVASIIWAVTVSALLIVVATVYVVSVMNVRDAQPLKENIHISHKVQIPAVYGIMKPKIILPVTYSPDKLDCIQMHEMAHIRRGDHVFRILALIITCIHWFNPVAWLVLKSLYADMEMACDETVLSRCTDAQRKEYALALLSATEKNGILVSPFGGASIKERIKNVLSYKKLSWLSLTAFTALILSIAYVLLTNAS